MILRDMPDLDAAIFAESWAWLNDNATILADAVARQVRSGASPEEIRQHVMRRTQRDALALRCQQAAAHLRREWELDRVTRA